MANKYTRKGRGEKAKGDKGAAEALGTGPDEFVTFWGRAYEALEPHFRQVAIGLLTAVVVVIGVWIFTYYRDLGREEASEMFSRAVRIYEGDLLPVDAKDAKEPDKKSEDDTPRFKTAEERAKATLDELAKLEKQHGSARVTSEAQAFRAGVLYDLGKFDKAKYDESRAVAEKFAGSASQDDPLRAIALEDQGLALEDKGQLDEAIAAYKESEQKGGDFYRERALYDQARVLVKKGDRDGAKKVYKQILDKMPTGLLHEEVQNRLTAIGG